MLCGSGLKAVMLAAQAVATEEFGIVVAGGMESMSQAPFVLKKVREGYRLGNETVLDHLLSEGLWDSFNDIHMGSTAEFLAKERRISREEQDAYAMTSYNRALEAIRKLLQKTGVDKDKVGLYEINEAFSVASVAALRELKLDPEKVNVNGGDVAMGHPIGSTGARILATLLYAMEDRGVALGVASVCLGGGEAVAMLVAR